MRMGKKPRPIHDRLLEKIVCNIETRCWEFQGSRDEKGYGHIRGDAVSAQHPRKVRAHRASYQAFVGDIPEGMFVCHKCDNPCCCNPEHLFLGTPRDNVRDMLSKGRSYDRRSRRQAAKLNWETVGEIRRQAAHGMNYVELGHKYGVTSANIGCIVRNQTWRVDARP